MKIVFLDTKTFGKDITLDRFNELGEITTYETTVPTQTLERVKEADIVVTNKVVIDKEILEKSNIKLVCVAATGTNNVDKTYAKEHGIEVKNVAGYSTASVSQVTISLVLHFVQKLNYYINYVREKNWEKLDIFTHIDEPFYELENKKWGIIGLGTIGKKVANIAESFGCEVNYYSASGKNNNTEYTQVNLEKLLKESDIITIHSALNDKTKNLINNTNLNMLKDGAILVNVGRGGIINEEDLTNTLNKGKRLYVGLDVVSVEPIEKDNPLNFVKNKEQLVITPHIAWGSIEARNRLLDGVLDNIKKFVV